MKFLNLFGSSEVAAMETRAASPSHCLIKIESYSLLNNKYETSEFAAGEYKWKLIICPNGDHISVYLAMAETSSLPSNWEVNASFSIFLFNQISGNYVYSPGTTRCFQATKTEWGISKFISKKTLSKSSNGYLINDSCVFGAEVFIVQRQAIIECLSLKNVNNVCKHKLKISEFSKLQGICVSKDFYADGQKWKMQLYPKGTGEGSGRYVSIYLQYLGSERVETRFSVRMKSQVSDKKHLSAAMICWFSSKSNRWGWDGFIMIDSINDPENGYLLKDCCHFDLEISVRAVHKYLN